VAVFKQIGPGDISTAQSFLTQLVDVIASDVSGSTTCRKYQVFVTGANGRGAGVTSSLFQTVCDQDYTLQTSNEILDMTVGLRDDSLLVKSASTGKDTAGKKLFPSESLMMREKISIYSQYSLLLLGASGSAFKSPQNSTLESDKIDNAMFISFKRLFSRDSIKENSFALEVASSGCKSEGSSGADSRPNINRTSNSGTMFNVYTDAGLSTSTLVKFGGTCSDIVNATNTAEKVGNIFYQHGIVVLDIEKVFSGSQKISGTIDAVTSEGNGKVVLGALNTPGSNKQAKLVPDLMVSGSIDDILDFYRTTRFKSGSQTCYTFMNRTNINSTLIWCRATADEFNYSSNPTYVDPSTNRINVIEVGQENFQSAFSYITTVGLYDPNDNLVAIAKMSRPIAKNNEKDITIRVRLDF